MKSKKIALIASILMATLVVGVYAVVLSNKVTTTWTLREPENNLRLYWASGEEGYGKPTGAKNRGQWIKASIGLENTGGAPYDAVIDKFRIVHAGLVPGDIFRLEYNEREFDRDDFEDGWTSMIGVLKQGVTSEVTGWFGPSPAGFTVDVGYDKVAHFRIMFDGDAPTGGYSFEAWVEQVP